VRVLVVSVLLSACNQVLGVKNTNLGIEIASVSPADGPSAGGTAVTITGTRFRDVDTVLFGDVAVPVAPTSDGEIDVVAPQSPVIGPVDVVVESTARHVGATASGAFTYHALGFVQSAGLKKTGGGIPFDIAIAATGAGTCSSPPAGVRRSTARQVA
jgi:hypothetical protein